MWGNDPRTANPYPPSLGQSASPDYMGEDLKPIIDKPWGNKAKPDTKDLH
jgi:hypothetical protein